ncbi:MAG: rRNA methyltransferase, partial [Catalinimonas sp.]
LFRRDPAAVGEWSEAAAQLCAERQRRILMDVWPALRPGGWLLYSTCTYHPEENEANLRWLAGQHDVTPVPVPEATGWGAVEVPAGPLVGYQCYPHRVRGEGFFFALLRKGSGGAVARSSKKKGRRGAPKLPPAARAERTAVAGWLREAHDWVRFQDKLLALPAGRYDDVQALADALRLVRAGVEVAEVKGKTLNPLPALALTPAATTEAFPTAEVDHVTALRFLRRDEVLLPEQPRGWVRVAFRGVGLGWIKNLGNRTNNYFPKEWRLRQDLPDAPASDAPACDAPAWFTLADGGRATPE